MVRLTVTNNSIFNKYVHTVLVSQSFYQIGVHGVLAVVCRVCVQWRRQDFVSGAQVWRREKTENNKCMSIVPPHAALYTPEYALLH